MVRYAVRIQMPHVGDTKVYIPWLGEFANNADTMLDPEMVELFQVEHGPIEECNFPEGVTLLKANQLEDDEPAQPELPTKATPKRGGK